MAAKKKPGKKNGAKPKRKDRVHELVKIQQRSVGRIARYGSTLATQVTGGDFSISRWIGDYANLWKDLAEDTGDAIRVMFPASKRDNR